MRIKNINVNQIEYKHKLSIIAVLTDNELQNKRDKFTFLSQYFFHIIIVVVLFFLNNLIGCIKGITNLFFQIVPERFYLTSHTIPLTHTGNPVEFKIIRRYFILQFVLFQSLLLLLPFYTSFHITYQYAIALLLQGLLLFVE